MLAASLSQRVYTSLKDLGLQLLPGYQGSGAISSQMPKTRILVAYSGGMDSTMLLDALAQLRTQFHLELYAAYYNHQWRPGAPRELPILHKTTQTLQVPLIIIEADRSLPKTETVARTHRYQALSKLAADIGAHAVVTAHHADDQIETVLFRILRGTGLDGLVGIQRDIAYEVPILSMLAPEVSSGNASLEPASSSEAPRQKTPTEQIAKKTAGAKQSAFAKTYPVHVLRPLLGVAKADIVDYVSERQLRYFDDPSNDNVKLQRNLIRKKILPELQQHFPQVKNALYKIALLAEGDHDIIEKSLDDLWSMLYLSDEKGYYLNATQFNQIELPYQRRVLKRFFERHQVEVDFQVIEDALLFVRGEHRKDLSIGLKSIAHHKDMLQSAQGLAERQGEKKISEHYFLSLYKNRLRILHMPTAALAPLESRQKEAVSVTVAIPGSAASEALGVSIEISEIAEDAKNRLSKPAVLKASALLDPNVAYVDLSLFIDGPEMPQAPKPLELRTRRTGDKFFQMGMTAPMRLKKYLINKGVPRFERDTLPLLASGEHVLWIPGYALSDYVKVSEKPTHRLQVEYIKPRSDMSDLAAYWQNVHKHEQQDGAFSIEGAGEAHSAEVYAGGGVLLAQNKAFDADGLNADELTFSDSEREDAYDLETDDDDIEDNSELRDVSRSHHSGSHHAISHPGGFGAREFTSEEDFEYGGFDTITDDEEDEVEDYDTLEE